MRAGPQCLPKQARRAAAAVEFAAVLPMIVTLLLGLWEVGRLIEVQQVINNAAREGARLAALGQSTSSQVTTAVTNYLAAAGYNTANVTVTVKNLGFSGNPTPPDDNPTNATQMDQLQITVTIPFQDVQWEALGYFVKNNTVLSAKVVWALLKDLSYPSVDYPPSDS